jgi:hypothetical protein
MAAVDTPSHAETAPTSIRETVNVIRPGQYLRNFRRAASSITVMTRAISPVRDADTITAIEVGLT